MIRSKLFSAAGTSLLVLAIAGCGGSSSSNNSSGGGGSSNVSCTPAGTIVCVEADPTNVGKFNPQSVTVTSGGKVTWTFVDSANQHTVTFDDGSFDSQPQAAGYTHTETISKPAGTTISYHCTLHANMTGKIVVQ